MSAIPAFVFQDSNLKNFPLKLKQRLDYLISNAGILVVSLSAYVNL
jgi:hypothetical protein